MAKRQPWHSRFYLQAYHDFSVPAPPADRFAYWVAVAGQIIYRACLVISWITLAVCALPFGVWVEPPWQRHARFRLLQFAGRIPAIAVALPLLLAYAAYRTMRSYGAFHVILPFAAVGICGAAFLTLLAGFNLLRHRPPRAKPWP